MWNFFNDSNVMKKESNVILLPFQGKNIENRVQIRPILYSFQSMRLQIFFRVNNKIIYTSVIFNRALLFGTPF